MKVVFPSVEFFRALQTLMQSDRERFKRLGYFDTRFGIRILDGNGPHEYVLGFEEASLVCNLLFASTVNEYLERLSAVGLDRRNRSRLPQFVGAMA